MAFLEDEEFGRITVRRSAQARQVRIRIAPDGSLRASLPVYAPLFLVKRLLKSSRNELRALLKNREGAIIFTDGMQIGKSHSISVRYAAINATHVKRTGLHIVATIPETAHVSHPEPQQAIRKEVIRALRLEAKNYLPRRIERLAEQHGFSYSSLRFSHASSRWGSCNSNGVISLNIALMKLPFELIDYVLIHELSHTRELNHSPSFWKLVESCHPNYAQDRQTLKNQSPSI